MKQLDHERRIHTYTLQNTADQLIKKYLINLWGGFSDGLEIGRSANMGLLL